MESTQQNTKEKKSTKKIYLILAACIVLAAGVFYWITSRGIETTDNAELDGDIVNIKSRVTAPVDSILFKDNQLVHKGDTLIILNTIELDAKLEQARAALANAKIGIKVTDRKASASLENANASQLIVKTNEQAIAAATSNLKRAQEEYDRNKKLLAIKGITQQDFTASQNYLDLAKAELEQAKSRMFTSQASAHSQQASAQSERAQIGTAEALVQQREAELRLAEYERSHAIITAPATGIITKRTVQTGNLVNNGQSLCAIVDTENLWITANVKESQLETIRLNQPVDIEIDAYPNVHITGKVQSFGGATGAKFALLPPDNATGNFVKIVQRVPIRIELDEVNNKELKSLLYPGLSAFVKIKTN